MAMTVTVAMAMPALALFSDVVENQLGRVLALVLEHKGDVVEAAADIRVVEEHVAPEFGKLLRGVAVAVAEAEVPDDDGAVVVVHADAQGGADLVAHHLALQRECILGAAVAQFRPAGRRHRDYRQVVPLV